MTLDATCILDSSNPDCEFHIEILDDFTAEMTEYFFISLTSNDPTRCNIANDNITIRVIDDGVLHFSYHMPTFGKNFYK